MRILPRRLLVVDYCSLEDKIPEELSSNSDFLCARLISQAINSFRANEVLVYGPRMPKFGSLIKAQITQKPPLLDDEWPVAALTGGPSPWLDFQADKLKATYRPTDTLSQISPVEKSTLEREWGGALDMIPTVLGLEQQCGSRSIAVSIMKRIQAGTPIKAKKQQKFVEDAEPVDVSLTKVDVDRLDIDIDSVRKEKYGCFLPKIMDLMVYQDKQDDLEFNAFAAREKALDDFLATIGDEVAVDTETTGLDVQSHGSDTVIGVSIASDEKSGAYIPISGNAPTIEDMLADATKAKIFHNAKFDLAVLKRLPAYAGISGPIYDTQVAAYLLGYGVEDDGPANKKRPLGLKTLARELLDYEMTLIDDLKTKEGKLDLQTQSLGQLAPYAASDAIMTYRLWQKFKPELIKNGLWDLFILEMKATQHLLEMEENGVYIDLNGIKTAKTQIEQELQMSKLKIYECIGDPEADKLDIDSPAQLSKILFGVLKLPPIKSKTTGFSVDKETLVKLEPMHPVIKMLQDYKALRTVLTTYLVTLPKNIASDGRFHTQYKQTKVVTGRLACVSLDTEILTSTGWKNSNEIKIGDSVLGYDISTNRATWTGIVDIHRGKGELFTFRVRPNDSVDGRSANSKILCTSNHNWVGQYTQAWDVNKSRTFPILTGYVQAKDLPKDRIRILLSSGKPDSKIESHISENDASLLGWIITDGCVIIKHNSRSFMVIGVSKPSSVAALTQLLRNFKHTESVRIHGLGHNNPVHTFRIGVDEFERFCQRTGFVSKSQDLTNIILSMGTAEREAMWWAMLEADGSYTRKSPRFGALDKSISSESFILLSTLLGKYFTCSTRVLKSGKRFNNFQIRSLNYTTKVKIEEPIGNQEVWCPETGTGNWIARRGNTIFLTGNSKPNLLSIPARGPGKIIRGLFVPQDRDYVLVGADFSQLEIRVMAHYSQDPALLDFYNTEEEKRAEGLEPDIYKMIASQVMDVKEEDVNPDQRSKAKILVLGMNYAMTEFGFSRQSGMSQEESKEFQNKYFDSFPGIKQYMKDAVEKARVDLEARSILGRRRRLPDLVSDLLNIRKEAERAAINFPIQASASDIAKKAMDLMQTSRSVMNLQDKSKLILHVHDEYIFECHRDVVSDVTYLLRESMVGAGQVVGLTVPLRTDVKVGNSWAEAKS